MLDTEKIKEKLQSALSIERYIHTLGVAGEAEKLAGKYGGEELVKKAVYAGLLHDCAKDYPADMKRLLGAEVARREYGVEDEEILEAIRWHTTGKADMTVLDKIIFIADYIEPNRESFDGLEEARRLAYEDLDKAMKYILESTIEYVKARKRHLHPYSLEALEYYSKMA